MLDDKINESGYKRKYICSKIKIDNKTLNNWCKYKNLTYIIKFLDLIHLLDIDFNTMYTELKKKTN